MTNPKKDSRPDLALCSAIETRRKELALSRREVAERLGFSQPYFALLMSGHRSFASVRQAGLKCVAEFLDMPLIAVMVKAGIVSNSDLHHRGQAEEQVERLYQLMQTDARIAASIPPRTDWEKTPLSVRLLSAVLYHHTAANDLAERMVVA